MSEDIRWKTKVGIFEQGTVRQDGLDFFQQTTRHRGYSPFLLEMALGFGTHKAAAARERTLIIQHLARVTYEIEKPKQDIQTELLPQTMPSLAERIDLKPFTGRDCWSDLRDRMIYWHDAADVGYLPGTVDYVLHEE
jgi:hypothetical protein